MVLTVRSKTSPFRGQNNVSCQKTIYYWKLLDCALARQVWVYFKLKRAHIYIISMCFLPEMVCYSCRRLLYSPFSFVIVSSLLDFCHLLHTLRERSIRIGVM